MWDIRVGLRTLSDQITVMSTTTVLTKQLAHLSSHAAKSVISMSNNADDYVQVVRD